MWPKKTLVQVLPHMATRLSALKVHSRLSQDTWRTRLGTVTSKEMQSLLGQTGRALRCSGQAPFPPKLLLHSTEASAHGTLPQRDPCLHREPQLRTTSWARMLCVGKQHIGNPGFEPLATRVSSVRESGVWEWLWALGFSEEPFQSMQDHKP